MHVCPICNQPLDKPYVNEPADERCVAECHDEYLPRMVRLNCEQTRRVIEMMSGKREAIVGGFTYVA